MNPRPRNFLDDNRMQNSSAFKVYNSIEFGIEGTSMANFDFLTEKEKWDIAFYVLTLRFLKQDQPKVQIETELKTVSLEQIATLSEFELLKKLTGTPEERLQKLKAIRLYVKK